MLVRLLVVWSWLDFGCWIVVERAWFGWWLSLVGSIGYRRRLVALIDCWRCLMVSTNCRLYLFGCLLFKTELYFRYLDVVGWAWFGCRLCLVSSIGCQCHLMASIDCRRRVVASTGCRWCLVAGVACLLACYLELGLILGACGWLGLIWMMIVLGWIVCSMRCWHVWLWVLNGCCLLFVACTWLPCSNVGRFRLFGFC